MKMKKTVFLFLLLAPILVFSQTRKSRYKYEAIFGLGFTNFLGELGGANQIGTHLLRDYEFAATRPLINGGIRYKNHPHFAFKGLLYAGMLYGNDKLTKEIYRQNRNLNFRAPIVELSAQVEGYFTKDKPRKIYKISGIKSRKKINWSGYGFTGISVFFFYPQGKYNGQWYGLRKLSTEGQGLPGGPRKYSLVQIAIPVGLGMKYVIDRKWSLNAEVGFRKTFTDYIDDVSGKYYDNATLRSAKGDNAANLADPNTGSVKNATKPSADGTPAQRGNPKFKDAYMFFTVSACYKFQKKKRTRAKF
jgi:hypothetical protein